AVPLLIGAGIVYAAFTASLGLWFSTMCKSSLRAILLTCLVLVFLLLNPGLANYMISGAPLFTSPGGAISNWPLIVLNYGLTPLGSLWALSFSSADFVNEESSTKALARILAALA